MRVLRRFTFTEKDPFDQNAKLLSAYTIADWSEADFNNRALFADHFLKWRLREYPAWNDDTKPTYIKLADLFAGARGHLSEANEAEARKQLLEPVLKILGFDFKAGKKAGSDGAAPDYRLFASGHEKPVAFCLAYRWDRFLDGQDELRDSESPNEFPARLAVDLLERSEASWGIVTNGRLWRLYSGKTYAKGTNYYEIDLEEVVSRADVADSFRYFWLLFRAQAFIPQLKDGEEPSTARSFLDEILAGSEEYAKKLGEALKERIFEEIFPHLAEGFIAYIRQKERKDAELSDERLRQVFHGTLTLLYRLLFLLYAEARDLLPVRDPRGYGEVSLGRIKKEIAEAAGTLRGKPGDDAKLRERYREDSFDLYKRLLDLCRIIDKGDAARNVPLYNGGLFLSDPEKDDETPEAEAARFLNKHLLPDRYFAPALDLLSRDVDEKSSQLVFIDYKSLGVRQLGSIYEGLLEFRLQIAKEKLGIKKEKGREVYESFKKLPEKDQIKVEKTGKVVKKGAVYLENDKCERKATGSYYTPDYIVKYIVEHAVGPFLEERFEKLRPKLREAEKWHREKMKQVEAVRHPGETRGKYTFGLAVEERWGPLVDNLLDIKVLDPAMGSGHFLVEVVDFVSDKLMKFLNAFSWDPLTARLKYTQQTILTEMKEREITIAREKLDLDLLLKRQVLKRCIYGVDLNPMAVELAKVSLWLHCFTLGAPLSFLDHHLRCGNSLIGVTEEDVKKASSSGQMNLLAGTHLAATKAAVGGMLLVSKLSDVTAAQIHESQEAYERALKALEPEKRLFNVYVSQWFSNAPKKRQKGEKATERTPVDEFLRGNHVAKWRAAPEKVSLSASEQRLIQNAADDALAHRFFHWELEFPEVFFGPKAGTEAVIERKPDGGFDAVVGNPPYLDSEEMTKRLPRLRDYASLKFESTKGNWDEYIPFLELSDYLVNRNGSSALLTPNKWLGAPYGAMTRQLFSGRVSRIGDFSKGRAFGNVGAFPIAAFVQKQAGQKIAVQIVRDDGAREPEIALQTSILKKVDGWGIALADEPLLLAKIIDSCGQVSDYAEVQSAATVSEAYEIANYVREGSGSDAKAFKLINTGTIDPYRSLWGESPTRYLKSTYSKPVIDVKILKREFPKRFEQAVSPKLITTGIRHFEVFFDSDGTYLAGKSTVVIRNFKSGVDPRFLLAVLNSTVLRFVLRGIYGVLAMDGGISFTPNNVPLLPVPNYDEKEVKLLVSHAACAMEQASRSGEIESSVLDAIDELVCAMAGLTVDESRIVIESGSGATRDTTQRTRQS